MNVNKSKPNETKKRSPIVVRRLVSEPKVKSLCKQINAVDDQLGCFSDHEGNQDGPTYRVWQMGKDSFGRQCDRAIRLHEQAAKIWKRAKQMNAAR